jgi:hypothetical protein
MPAMAGVINEQTIAVLKLVADGVEPFADALPP